MPCLRHFSLYLVLDISYFGCSESNSSVGIATGDGLNDQRFESRQGEDFSFFHNAQTGFGAHPAPYPVGAWTLSPGVKQPRREANHSPPSGAKVMNGGAIPPLPHRVYSWHSA
jgi:hypothetical protein